MKQYLRKPPDVAKWLKIAGISAPGIEPYELAEHNGYYYVLRPGNHTTIVNHFSCFGLAQLIQAARRNVLLVWTRSVTPAFILEKYPELDFMRDRIQKVIIDDCEADDHEQVADAAFRDKLLNPNPALRGYDPEALRKKHAKALDMRRLEEQLTGDAEIDPNAFCTLKIAAAYLGRSKKTVERLIADEKLEVAGYTSDAIFVRSLLKLKPTPKRQQD